MVWLEGIEVETNEEVIRAYRDRIRKTSYSAETLYYRSDEQHKKKLREYGRLIKVACPVGGMSILDVGCGYGSLLPYISGVGEYTGIDLVPEFVAAARKNFPGHEFYEADVCALPEKFSDICVLAGILSSIPRPEYVLSHVASIAKKAVLFDVILEGKLPSHFASLNRWSETEVEAILGSKNFRVVEKCERGSTWTIYMAKRE